MGCSGHIQQVILEQLEQFTTSISDSSPVSKETRALGCPGRYPLSTPTSLPLGLDHCCWALKRLPCFSPPSRGVLGSCLPSSHPIIESYSQERHNRFPLSLPSSTLPPTPQPPPSRASNSAYHPGNPQHVLNLPIFPHPQPLPWTWWVFKKLSDLMLNRAQSL